MQSVKICWSFLKNVNFVLDIKDFLIKVSSIKNIPENSFLVTMDVSSFYTNTSHEESAEACFKQLEERKDKSIPSIVIKNLILMILESYAFRFDNESYRQITGTAMGTPIEPNYANSFMVNWAELLRDYSQKTALSP